MAEIRGKYVYDDSYRPGQSNDGGWSQLLFDNEGKLADHAVFIPDDDDDGGDGYHWHVTGPDAEDPTSEEVSDVIGVAIGVAVVVGILAAPGVKRWWMNSFIPRLKKLRKRRNAQATVASLEITAVSADFSRAVEVAVHQAEDSMSTAEAQERLAAMLAAAAFVADQIRALRNARIDDTDMAVLSSAIDKLTTQQVADSVNRMLESDVSLLDEKTANAFMRIFGGGQKVDDRYVPIRRERIREALRLTRGESNADDGPSAFAPA